MILPSVRRFLAKRHRHSHLRHHGGAAAADQASVGEQHLRAAARRLDRRIHAGGAGADHQHVGVDLQVFCCHGGGCVVNAPARRAENGRSISLAFERSTGWPRLPSLPVRAASTAYLILLASPASVSVVSDVAVNRPTMPSGVPSTLASIWRGASARTTSTVTLNLNFI